jgi:DNA-binding GntR family transcriptional regulator
VNNFDRVEPRTLKADVLKLLRQAIIDGQLPPGAELNQTEIANELGISRGPVREALGQLEQEGLIHNVPYKGVVVTALTPEYIEEVYSIRCLLETLAVERAIARLTGEDLAQLNEIVEKMRAAVEAQDEQQLVQLDLRFHEYIVQMAEYKLLLKFWKLLEISVQRCLQTRHRIYHSLNEVIGDHPLLVSAIAERDAELASRLLRQHITEAGEQLLEHWSNEMPADDQ